MHVGDRVLMVFGDMVGADIVKTRVKQYSVGPVVVEEDVFVCKRQLPYQAQRVELARVSSCRSDEVVPGGGRSAMWGTSTWLLRAL